MSIKQLVYSQMTLGLAEHHHFHPPKQGVLTVEFGYESLSLVEPLSTLQNKEFKHMVQEFRRARASPQVCKHI